MAHHIDFYNKLEAINPMLVVHFENILFGCADHYMEGYNGGMWESGNIGEGSRGDICLIPTDGDVRLINANNFTDLTMDRISASTALTIIALNMLIWKIHEMNWGDAVLEKLIDMQDSLKDIAHANKELNQSAIFRFLD